ncbi:hypothetical protein GS831_01270 [Rhodococcus hoagii]|nr:hypothetical protein [Prescottella equi]
MQDVQTAYQYWFRPELAWHGSRGSDDVVDSSIERRQGEDERVSVLLPS